MEEHHGAAADCCPVCGEFHQECSEALLGGMAINASFDARQKLSSKGLEVFDMVLHAVRSIGFDETWKHAENVDTLHQDDIRVIEIYFARMNMIEYARRELYAEESY